MPKAQIQAEIFSGQDPEPWVEGADTRYQPDFLAPTEADCLFEHLLVNTNWQQDEITVYGKRHLTPRLSLWVADAGLTYKYSNMTMQAASWTPELTALRVQLQDHTGYDFNSVLLNYYRSGTDSNGWHADDEPELGRRPVIASVSLGASRDFQLRRRADHRDRHTLALTHGSLLLMSGNSQHDWQHQVPKRAQAGPRINLTFRQIKHQPTRL
ncbi:MAG: alpha-ketoglutarate-dependent dioxygenase AlkB [Gammaproteobacteria bacterium]|nr:alpha-ketoglutarate-dependent dioxygenase AlkB [Gammaproteobacteria bacterium]